MIERIQSSLIIPINKTIGSGLESSLGIRTNSAFPDKKANEDGDRPLYFDAINKAYNDAFRVMYNILNQIDLSKEEETNAFKEATRRYLESTNKQILL